MNTLVVAIIAVVLVSLMSLVGALTLILNKNVISKIIHLLVPLAVGSLVGGAALHLLPESVEAFGGFTLEVSGYFMGGILAFWVIEKFVFWHHCHHDHSAKYKIGYMNLIGDGFHNFLDGVVIAGAFVSDFHLGVATTIAVVLHEIPQELGDFGVLLHSGFSYGKALFLNLVSGFVALLGVLLVFVMSDVMVANFVQTIVPFTAGGFLYIALSDIIPELHKETKFSKNLGQLVMIVFGVYMMYLVGLVE